MSTMNQIVDAVLSEVYGGTQTVDSSTYLSSSCSATDLTFTVADASQFSRGIIQIDDELIMADAVDRAANTISCGNLSGRGIRGTTAATHTTGDRVVMSPSISRKQAMDAVAQTIRSSNGLFKVESTSFTYNASVSGYSVPTDVETVLSLTWKPSGPSNEYQHIRRWTYNRYNNQVVLGSPIEPGKTILVTYLTAPAVPAFTADFSDTGLPSSCEDVIRFGAAWRLVSFLEPMNLMAQSAEADAMDKQNRNSGSRLRVAQYLYQMYRQRLEEEVSSLQNLYPIRLHYGG